METVAVTCYHPGCGYSPFPMEEGYHNRCRHTHETFICPGGHRQHFAQETAEERTIRTLRADLDWAKNRATHWQNEWRIQVERVAHPLCPWPGCDFQGNGMNGLRSHMRARHGMPTLAAVEAEVA